MTGTDELVEVEIAGGVALVALNRPERQNAWSPALGKRFFAALKDLAGRADVRVVVMTGRGGHFCSGGDGELLATIADAGGHEPASQREVPWLALTIAKPVIAAIPGVCFGMGLHQALCCDIRFAADTAKFSAAYVRRGLVAEMGMSWLLPRSIGVTRAADMLFSGRVVRADEAERMGLVNRVVPAADLLDEALAYARGLAAHSAPQALRATKLQLYRDLMDDFFGSFERAEALLDRSFATDEFAEGVLSWRERRPPAFAPLPPELGRIELRDPPGVD